MGRIRSITIGVDTGAAKGVAEIEKLRASIKSIGGTTGDVQKVGAAIRVMEGNLTNNVRAAERFLATLPGIRDAISAAFPVVGLIAFGGVLAETAKRAADFFQELREAPEKSAAAWNGLLNPMKMAGDEADLVNAKLKEDILKLEDKPENGLELAIAAARVEADRLGASLAKGLASINKLSKDQTSGFWKSSWGAGLSGSLTGGFPGMIQALAGSGEVSDIQQKLGGVSGSGGLFASVQKYEAGSRDVHEYTALLKRYDAVISDISTALHGTAISQSQREMLESTARALTAQKATIPQAIATSDLTKTDDVLRAEKEAAELRKKAAQEAAEIEKKAQNERIEREMLFVQESYEQYKLDEEHQQKLKEAAAKQFELESEWQERQEERAGEAAAKQFELQVEYWEKQDERAIKFKEEIDKINLSGSSADNLARAAFGGQDAVRQAALQNKIAAIRINPNLSDQEKDDQVEATRTADQKEAYDQIVIDAGKLLTADDDRLETLQKQLAALKEYEALHGKTLETALAISAAQKESLKIIGDQELKEGTLKDSMKAFMAEMQEQAVKPGQILYGGLNDALSQFSGDLAKVFTGDKPKGGFRKMFGDTAKGIGQQMVSQSIKAAIQAGLAHFGKHKTAEDIRQRLGDKSDPLHVFVTNGGNSNGDLNSLPVGNINKLDPLAGMIGAGVSSGIFGKIFGSLGKIFTGGGGEGSATSTISFPGLADGGDVSPGSGYWVGENGPEPFFPKEAGTVVSRKDLGGMTVNHHYTIDARGAQLGVEGRISQAIEMAHASAVRQSMHAQAEHKRRTPRSRG